MTIKTLVESGMAGRKVFQDFSNSIPLNCIQANFLSVCVLHIDSIQIHTHIYHSIYPCYVQRFLVLFSDRNRMSLLGLTSRCQDRSVYVETRTPVRMWTTLEFCRVRLGSRHSLISGFFRLAGGERRKIKALLHASVHSCPSLGTSTLSLSLGFKA